jgi:hypothetical protein
VGYIRVPRFDFGRGNFTDFLLSPVHPIVLDNLDVLWDLKKRRVEQNKYGKDKLTISPTRIKSGMVGERVRGRATCARMQMRAATPDSSRKIAFAVRRDKPA